MCEAAGLRCGKLTCFSPVVPQSLGKPSVQQEDDSVKVLAGRYGKESRGWRHVYCVPLENADGCLEVLCYSILGKLDLARRVLGFPEQLC